MASRGRIKTAKDVRSVVKQKSGKPVSFDNIWDLLHRHGWKKTCRGRITHNEVLKNKLTLKKLPEKLESNAITFPPTLPTLPIIVFFKAESRFGRIGREMACWVKASIIRSVGKQMIREYIYAY